jgi:hypothetical protein
MTEQETKAVGQITTGKTKRFSSEYVFLLFCWLSAFGLCLLLCNALITALCHLAIPYH